jgi:hypothetical protein
MLITPTGWVLRWLSLLWVTLVIIMIVIRCQHAVIIITVIIQLVKQHDTIIIIIIWSHARAVYKNRVQLTTVQQIIEPWMHSI